MKLTKKEKEILLDIGYPIEDVNYIETGKFTFEDKNNNKLTQKKTRELLSNRDFLSGLGRARFHMSAVRHSELHKDLVYFRCLNWNK